MNKIIIAQFVPQTRSAVMQRLCHEMGVHEASYGTLGSGKPLLIGVDGTQFGLSISHLHDPKSPFSIMAIGLQSDFAIDIAQWPVGPTDEAFLESVTSPEDHFVTTRLVQRGIEPAKALWVIKEAALKASGEVKNDPRHVAVQLLKKRHIYASLSHAASRPFPAAEVELFKLVWGHNEESMLLAIARVSGSGKHAGLPLQLVNLDANWAVETINLGQAKC